LTAAAAHAGADKKSLSYISLAQKMLLGEKELVDVIRVVTLRPLAISSESCTAREKGEIGNSINT
jgi:hypothetical protein